MDKIIEKFTAELIAKQQEYDGLLVKATICLSNRMGHCNCKAESRCLSCKQDGKLFDEIEALEIETQLLPSKYEQDALDAIDEG